MPTHPLVYRLRGAQLEQNAERAQRMAEERLAAEAATAEAATAEGGEQAANLS